MTIFASHSQYSATNNEPHTQRRFENADAASDRSQVRLQTFHDAETAEAVHDFRNILCTVSILSELALMDLPEASRASANVRRIKAACADANDLCNQMLDDSQNASKSVERVDLSTVIMAIAPLLTAYVSAESALRFNLTDGVLLVNVSPGGIRQVVMNLVKNAAEALKDQPGAITVSTGLVELDAEGVAELDSQNSIRTESYSYLDVSDTGCGMDEATRARVFERHFTTKPDGHGLGMASIRRIVHGCGGEIQVQSEVGVGTRIRLLFPRSNPSC